MNALRQSTLFAALASATLLGVAHAPAQTIVGTGIPAGATSFSPVGVSADGLTVLGNDNAGRAFLWTAAGGFQPIGVLAGWGITQAYGLSSDGTTVGGRLYRTSPGTFHACRWNVSTGFQDLGLLPGGTFSFGYGISRDGNVVVGQGSNGTTAYRAIRWAGGVLSQLPHVTGSISDAEAWGANADGSVVVGQDFVGGTSAGYRGFRWTAAGIQTLLPPTGQISSRAFCCSADGTIVAGSSNDSSSNPLVWPVMWDATGAVTNLGLPVGMGEAQPSCISADGSVVGLLSRVNGSPVAGLWSAATGTINLNTYLPTIGVNLTGWSLSRTYAISADGRTIVGEGGSTTGSQAFIVTLQCLAAPTIITHPTARTSCATGQATFTVIPSGTGPYTFHWRQDTVPIDAITNPSAATASLTITDVKASDVGLYDCIVSNACGGVTSNAAHLYLSSADFNNDGDVGTDQDIEAFFGCLGGNCCLTCPGNADFNGDGDVGTDADIESFFRVLAGGPC